MHRNYFCAADGRRASPISTLAPDDQPAMPTQLTGPPMSIEAIGKIGRFEILECVGRGGMGVVYQAKDPVTEALVAIKLLQSSLANDRRASRYFLKEAHHMERLRHPHVMPILESSGEREATPFLVMPFLKGGNLSELLRKRRRLSQEFIINLSLQIGSALLHAHSRGLIHRDLKPTNILFDEEGNGYLADFGLCRSLLNDPALDVQQSSVEGTLQYQSPQAANGEYEDTRGDIYSFGAVMYEMLTGQPPYEGVARAELARAIRESAPTEVLKINPKAPRRLAVICEGAMGRELHRRYPHMSYVVSDLERVRRNLSPRGPHLQPAWWSNPIAKVVRLVRRCRSSLAG